MVENEKIDEIKKESEEKEIPSEENINESENNIESKKVEETEEVNPYKEELDKIKKESEQYKDSWIRERAEFQNYKKRILQDIENSKRNTIRKVVENIINPIDNLERMTQNQKDANSELKPFLDGIEMIKKEFYSALEKENIFRLNPLNEVFDPSKMEALSSEENENYKEETVVEVYQAGYMIKENKDEIVLRPSRVKIAKPKSN